MDRLTKKGQRKTANVRVLPRLPAAFLLALEVKRAVLGGKAADPTLLNAEIAGEGSVVGGNTMVRVGGGRDCPPRT